MAFSATYSPQDDKIRLFFGGERIPKPEWDRLKAAGFTWTMKQDSDMVGLWTPAREDIALDMCGDIEDEDQPREERAADRAERFEGYRDKREGEAVGLADRFDNGPTVHGNQSLARATRAAARHDRIGGQAGNQWAKAEYWQRRTAGVIAHALYLEQPAVRHRRIKGLEADLRKLEKSRAESVAGYNAWKEAAAMTDQAAQAIRVRRLAGDGGGYYDYQHPTNPARRPASLWSLMEEDQPEENRINAVQACALYLAKHSDPTTWGTRWADHTNLRLAYERQMLAGQGGTAADVEMVAGGFIGARQIQKVTKDRAGRVSKLYFGNRTVDAEGLAPGSYRAPTAAELEAFTNAKPKAPPLLNPSPEQAAALVAAWNAAEATRKAQDLAERKGGYLCEANYDTEAKVRTMTAAQFTVSGKYSDSYMTRELSATGAVISRYHGDDNRAVPVCRIRTVCRGYRGCDIVCLTDKPAAALPLLVAVTA